MLAIEHYASLQNQVRFPINNLEYVSDTVKNDNEYMDNIIENNDIMITAAVR